MAEQAPITEFTNLISGRAPGVQVPKSSGTTGTGTRIRIRIRGLNSISLVFPTGPYHKGGSYGSDVNLPVPIEEQNNPNVMGCLDRNA